MQINPCQHNIRTNSRCLNKVDGEANAPSDSVTISGSSRFNTVNTIDPSLINKLFETCELKSLWNFEIQYAYGCGNTVLPMKNGEVCVGQYRKLSNLDAKTGKLKWEKDIVDYYGKDFDSQYTDGKIYLKENDVNTSDNDHILVMDACDGKEKWRHKIDQFEGLRVTDGGDVYLKQKRGYIVLDGNDGKEKKNVVINDEKEDRYILICAIRKDGAVIASSPDNSYALAPDGSLLWKDWGATFMNAFFTDHRALVTGPGGYLIMKDLNKGENLWKCKNNSLRVNCLSDSKLFASNIYDLHCLSLSDGHEKWVIKGDQKEHSIIKALGKDGTPYVARGNRIEALDTETGKPDWSLALPSDQLERRGTAIIEGNRLYLSDSERIHVIDINSGLKISQFSAKDNCSISNFVLSGDNTMFVQVNDSKDSSHGSAKLFCVDLGSDALNKEIPPAENSENSSIEVSEEWVDIAGVRIPVGKKYSYIL